MANRTKIIISNFVQFYKILSLIFLISFFSLSIFCADGCIVRYRGGRKRLDSDSTRHVTFKYPEAEMVLSDGSSGSDNSAGTAVADELDLTKGMSAQLDDIKGLFCGPSLSVRLSDHKPCDGSCITVVECVAAVTTVAAVKALPIARDEILGAPVGDVDLVDLPEELKAKLFDDPDGELTGRTVIFHLKKFFGGPQYVYARFGIIRNPGTSVVTRAVQFGPRGGSLGDITDVQPRFVEWGDRAYSCFLCEAKFAKPGFKKCPCCSVDLPERYPLFMLLK